MFHVAHAVAAIQLGLCEVAVIADQDSVRAAKVTAVLIKRCRTVLTERCGYIAK